MTASLSIDPSRRIPISRKRPKPPRPAGTPSARKEAADQAGDAMNLHVGGRIRRLRLSQGKTQAELGWALGLTNQQVQKYEKGRNNMTLRRLFLTARFLNITMGELLEGVEDAAVEALPRSVARLLAGEVTFRRLRLSVAEALRGIESEALLRGVLGLLRATEAEAEAQTQAEDDKHG
jgi:transcriptional regulator with XRE-family HTH domain